MKKKSLFKIFILGLITLWITYFLTNNLTPKIFFSLGKIKFEKGNFESAQHYFKQSLLFHPENKDYRYYYVKSLIELPPTYDVQKKVYNFVQDNIDDGAYIIASEQVREWKHEILEEYTNNYIEQAPQDSNIVRWNKKSFPLKVYIQKDNSLPDYYKSSINKALSQWDRAFDFISFTNEYNRSSANIIIEFKDIPKDVCNNNNCLYVVATTVPTTKGSTLKHMVITFYKTNPNGTYYTDSEVYNVILHELGHALGILGHSYSTEDLMYQQAKTYNPLFSRFRNEYQYLTGSDINTVNLLYKLVPTITDRTDFNKKDLIYAPIILGNTEQMLNKKIAEYERYIKNAPHLAAGYINIATAYTEAKQYNKAIHYLKKALDLADSNNEKYIIYYNFSIIYLNLNQPTRALEYAQIANNIKNTDEIRELIGVIKNRFN